MRPASRGRNRSRVRVVDAQRPSLFVGSRGLAWAPQRDETETAWQPQQAPKERGQQKGQQRTALRSRAHASRCSAVQQTGGAARCRVDPRLCCRSCAVLSPGSPYDVRQYRPLKGAAYSSSSNNNKGRAGRRLRIAICGLRAAGWSVGRGCGCAMAENLGAGGRSSRWCRQAGLDVRLCRTTTRDGYDAACDQQQRNVYGSEQLWNNGVHTDVQNRSLRSRVPNLLCGGELPEQPLVTWAPVKVRQGSWAQVKSTVAYPIRMYTL